MIAPTSGAPREQSIVSPARNSLDEESNVGQSAQTERMAQLAAKRPSFKTRVRELRDASVTGSFGSDCTMDPWCSLRQADMLDVAFMGLHVGQFSSPADLVWCLDAVTTNSAQIVGLDDYAIARGCDASFVMLQAKDKIGAIRLLAHRFIVVRKGNLVAKPAPVVAALLKEGDAAILNESSMKD